MDDFETVPTGEPKPAPDPEPAPEQTTVFAADLTREEYQRFYMLLMKMNGPLKFQKPAAIMFLVMAGLCMASVGYVFAARHIFDWMTVLMMGLLILLGAFVLLGIPFLQKRSAGKQYDQAVAAGGGFYGHITLCRGAIRKETASGVTEVPLNSGSLFLENTDMVAFIPGTGVKNIVIPARCLTPELVTALRAEVFRKGATVKRSVKAPLIPAAREPLAMRPLSRLEEETLLELSVCYSEREFLRLTGDAAWRRFFRILPAAAVMAVLIGAIFAWIEENIGAGLIAFGVMMLLLLLLGVLLPLWRMKRTVTTLPEERRRMIFRLTDRSIITCTPSYEERGRFAWSALKRAVEKPDAVELYLQNGFLYIPRSAVPDMDRLRQIVDSHIPKQ